MGIFWDAAEHFEGFEANDWTKDRTQKARMRRV